MHLLGDSVILLALEYSSRELNLSTLNHTSITHCRFQETGRHCKLGNLSYQKVNGPIDTNLWRASWESVDLKKKKLD